MLCNTLYVCVCKTHVCEKEKESDQVWPSSFFNRMGCTHFFNIHNWIQIVLSFVSVMAWIITSGELNTYTVKVCKENYTVRV